MLFSSPTKVRVPRKGSAQFTEFFRVPWADLSKAFYFVGRCAINTGYNGKVWGDPCGNILGTDGVCIWYCKEDHRVINRVK